MNKIEDFINYEQIIINKPVKINLDMNDINDFSVELEGEFCDLLGASFDLISGIIEECNIDRPIMYTSICNKCSSLLQICKEKGHSLKKSSIHFSMDENQYIEMLCDGNIASFLYLIVQMIINICSKYDISYVEYFDWFKDSDALFIKSGGKEKMNRRDLK